MRGNELRATVSAINGQGFELPPGNFDDAGFPILVFPFEQAAARKPKTLAEILDAENSGAAVETPPTVADGLQTFSISKRILRLE